MPKSQIKHNLFMINNRALKFNLINFYPEITIKVHSLIKKYGGECVDNAADADLVIAGTKFMLEREDFEDYPKLYRCNLISDSIKENKLVEFEKYRIIINELEEIEIELDQLSKINTRTHKQKNTESLRSKPQSDNRKEEKPPESHQKINKQLDEKENTQLRIVEQKSKRKQVTFDNSPSEMVSPIKSQGSNDENDKFTQAPVQRPQLPAIHFDDQPLELSSVNESQKNDKQLNGEQNNEDIQPVVEKKVFSDNESTIEKNQKEENNNQNKEKNIKTSSVNQTTENLIKQEVLSQESFTENDQSDGSESVADIPVKKNRISYFDENSRNINVTFFCSQSTQKSRLSSISKSMDILEKPFCTVEPVSSPQLSLTDQFSQDIIQPHKKNNEKSVGTNSNNEDDEKNESENNIVAESIHSEPPDIEIITEVSQCKSKTPENIVCIDLLDDKTVKSNPPLFYLHKLQFEHDLFKNNKPLKVNSDFRIKLKIDEQDIEDWENLKCKSIQSKLKRLPTKSRSVDVGGDDSLEDIRFKGFQSIPKNLSTSKKILTSDSSDEEISPPLATLSKHRSSKTYTNDPQPSTSGLRKRKKRNQSLKSSEYSSTKKYRPQPKVIDDTVIISLDSDNDDDGENAEEDQKNNGSKDDQDSEEEEGEGKKNKQANPRQRKRLETIIWDTKFINHPYVLQYDRYAHKYQKHHNELKKKPFQLWEQQAMLWYLIKKNGFQRCFHNSTFWSGMVSDGFLPHRSGDSILNHFQRQIMKKLDQFRLPLDIRNLF